MCANYGFLTKKPSARNVCALRALGVMMEDRGKESTGVAMFTDKVEIQKDIGRAEVFFQDVYLDPNAWMGIAHNRLSSRGTVTKENSHPFQFGNIVGTHNGTITNYLELGDFEVDSQVLFNLLNETHNNFREVLAKVSGAVAAVWTDGEKLYFVRHFNPLHIALMKDGLYWASDFDCLKHVCIAQGRVATHIEVETDEVLVFDRDLKMEKFPVSFKTYYSDYKKDDHKGYLYGRDYEYDPDEFVSTRQVIKANETDMLNIIARAKARVHGCKRCDHEILDNRPFWYGETTQDCLHYNCIKSKRARRSGMKFIPALVPVLQPTNSYQRKLME